MKEKLLGSLTKRMADYRIIEEADREYYVYLIECLFEKLIGCACLLLVSYATGCILETIFFFAFFSQLRKYTGGYHCSSFLLCTLCSILIVLLNGWLVTDYATGYPVYLITGLIAALGILLIGAVNHPNMNWSAEEYKKSASMARTIVVVEYGILLCTSLIGVDVRFVASMANGIAVCAILIIIAKLVGQEVKSYEKRS